MPASHGSKTYPTKIAKAFVKLISYSTRKKANFFTRGT